MVSVDEGGRLVTLLVDLVNLGLRLAQCLSILGTKFAVEVVITSHNTFHLLHPCILRATIVLLLYGVSVGETWGHLVALKHLEI